MDMSFVDMKQKEALELRKFEEVVRVTRSITGGSSEITKTGNRIWSPRYLPM